MSPRKITFSGLLNLTINYRDKTSIKLCDHAQYASRGDNPFLEKALPEEKQVYFERQLTWALRFLSPLTRYFREGDLRAEFASFF